MSRPLGRRPEAVRAAVAKSRAARLKRIERRLLGHLRFLKRRDRDAHAALVETLRRVVARVGIAWQHGRQGPGGTPDGRAALGLPLAAYDPADPTSLATQRQLTNALNEAQRGRVLEAKLEMLARSCSEDRPPAAAKYAEARTSHIDVNDRESIRDDLERRLAQLAG